MATIPTPGARRSLAPERGGTAGRLSADQHQRKEKILTQPSPAKVRETSSAVVLKQGSLFLLSADSGDVPWKLPHGFGLFYEDCRFLDGYTLALNGTELTILSSVAKRNFETRHDLTNPELPAPNGGPPIPKETIVIQRRRHIHGGVLHEELGIRNYGDRAVGVEMEFRFRARFEDLFILKGFVAGPRGVLHAPRVVNGDTIEFRYSGQDGYRRSTRVGLNPPPADLAPGRARYRWLLEPGADGMVSISVSPHADRVDGAKRSAVRPPSRTADLQLTHLERSDEIWLAGSADFRASNPLFERVLRRALLDLRLLRSRQGRYHYFAAGIPWFATLFGRDAATVAIQTLPYGSSMAGETLRILAHHQATSVDAYRDAEPGKILHELRTGELARGGAIPQSLAYYGTIDATLLFLILLAEYVRWSGDLDLARTLRPNMEAALDWIERYADHDGDGYLDYLGRYGTGLINQGWKDSGNAVVNADGSLATPPIALCEVQAYLYRSLREVATLLRALGEPTRAAGLDRRGDELRARFERDFWSEELGCYVLALQDGGRPAAVVSSNTGQVLWGGIASPERAARVATRLLEQDMFSGWGIRTLSKEERAYNPVSYHLGSVWPHDNSLIVAGLRGYGLDGPAMRIFDALFDAACSFPDYRMPELYCGFERREDDEQPVRYPVACSPQAWAAGAIPYGLRSLLGLRPDAANRRLRVVRPRLPTWLDWLEVRGTQVGSAHVDLRFERVGPEGAAEMRLLGRRGDLLVEQTEAAPTAEIFG